MGILKRMTDMTKASLNEMLDKMEDPVIMLNQYLRDMEVEVSEAERTVARQMASEQRMKYRLDDALKTASELETRALAALRDGQEEQARVLLAQKVQNEQKAEEYRGLYQQLLEQGEELRQELDSRKEELQSLRNKRSELASRAEAAKAKKQVADLVPQQHSIEGGGAVRGFNRMEEKILQLEAEAEVARMPGAYRQPTSAAVPNPAQSQQVEEQLALLKQKLGEDTPKAVETANPEGEAGADETPAK
ncbi:PspA/IM30 family protein [Paenibacillaceae bacterium]|nr:PspA/IM30 family protein [Paenibacillaceae bacterium]